MHKIVIDTNVLRSALTSKNGASFKILSLLAERRFRLFLSTTLVLEYEAVLKREISGLEHRYIDDILDYICVTGEKEEIFFLWRPILKDPNDDFLLELAVKAGADIVTHNVKDFEQACRFGVRVFTPKEFLGELKR